MSSVYDKDIYDPISCELKLFQTEGLILVPELWEKFKIDDLIGVDFSKWERVKLMDNGKFSRNISKIPKGIGGIYVFSIEPNIIPNVGSYVMYIGKATSTNKGQDLRKRVKSYSTFAAGNKTRDKLYTLFNLWGDYVYVHYLPVDSESDVIEALEDRLIGAFGRPPCNQKVRINSVKHAVNAFV